MTAEIAILNRSALALAADSAVTISVDGKTKVYDTAEKLFEFSKTQPIAFMIYNNVEFVGVPLDVLVRKFRAERHAEKVRYKTIKEASDDFLGYLGGFDHDIQEEKRHLYQHFHERFTRINKRVSSDVLKRIKEGRVSP